jgi:NAD(P)-dependent dehydrogenase (short-subunit alcohol dehydrogenase family)
MSSRRSQMFELIGRVAIVTGAAGMLGRQYAMTLLEAGARVVLADINADAAGEAAREVMGEAGGTALAWGVDISQPDQVSRMVSETVQRWGRIDILVNNAAIDPKFDTSVAGQQSIAFEDYPLDLWQRSLDVNLTGAFLCAQAVGKVMVRQSSGVMVNISSTYGLVAPDQRLYRRDSDAEQTLFKPVSYAVTKAGIAHLTRYLAAYWGAKNIRVNTLTPGGVRSAQDDEFVQKYSARTPLGRMADKNELCGALLFLVSDASSYMTGANLVVDGGWTAW